MATATVVKLYREDYSSIYSTREPANGYEEWGWFIRVEDEEHGNLYYRLGGVMESFIVDES